MNSKLNNKKRIIFVIGYPWPYSYGGHRTTKLCRELSKDFKVICITRPLFRYLDKLKDEPFEIVQTKGLVSIYDPLRIIFKIFKSLIQGENQNKFIDSGLVSKISKKRKDNFLIGSFIKFILKIKFFVDSYIALPDDHWPWIISSYFLIKRIYGKNKPFMIISSFPVSSHVIASRIKKMDSGNLGMKMDN